MLELRILAQDLRRNLGRNLKCNTAKRFKLDEHINSPPYVTHNTDNTQTNQGAINIYKQVVINNFNCSNTSLSGQSKSQSTNKSEVARKSQNQQNPKQTAPKQVSQTKTPVQKPKEAPQAPLPQETKKTQSQIPLVKSKHTSHTSSQKAEWNLSQREQYNYCIVYNY
ncbi:Hypothetical_protein [Hexamita inflata]|uniref:Hypothetical_protein n=1 Tax=Hexamita inflata TaxID=28002 RepID=A0AA86U8Q1_9EUKA|nr:Hypothetical protein HINF_LOCUS35370 [Hexamita inflata]